MSEHADSLCGTIDEAYQRERAADGSATTTIPDSPYRRRKYPCDGYD